MDFTYLIKPNNIRVKEENKTGAKQVFLSKGIYNCIFDKNTYKIYCEFFSYSMFTGEKQLDHWYIVETNKIVPLDFDSSSYHYKNENVFIDKHNSRYGYNKLYDVLLGEWIENPTYYNSSAYLIFDTKKELAKFKISYKEV